MEISEELVQKLLERSAEEVETRTILVEMYNDLQLLKKAANITAEEEKPKKKEEGK